MDDHHYNALSTRDQPQNQKMYSARETQEISLYEYRSAERQTSVKNHQERSDCNAYWFLSYRLKYGGGFRPIY